MRKPRVKRTTLVSYPAPTLGLVLAQNPARPTAGGAEVLENGIPTDRGIRVRGGQQRAAFAGTSTEGDFSVAFSSAFSRVNLTGEAVTSLFAYNHPSTPALFAATATKIYNVTGLAPDVAVSPTITGQTSGYYSTAQIGTAGGDFLYMVNGTDSPILWNGTTATAITGVSTPAITGVTTSTLSAVWLYRNRLFFVQKNTLVAWYLGVDSIGGAANDVSLAGVFQKGGSLLFGATWSLDSGDGLDDKCVFVSTEGEIAIYEGSDPSEVNDWRLVGRYDIARPLGINAYMQAGGDLLIATADGIVPLSQVIQKDPAALSLSAVTRAIEPLWESTAARSTAPVELVKWAERGLGIVTLPDLNDMLLVNLQSGAWAKITGWRANCATTFLGKCYIGRSDGRVCAIDEGGNDDGQVYTFRLCYPFEDGGDPSRIKAAKFIRLAMFTAADVNAKVSAAKDFNTDFPTAPAVGAIESPAGFLDWNTDDWNEANWFSDGVQNATRGLTVQHKFVAGMGYTLAPQVQITSGQQAKPNIELIRVDFAFEAGEAFV
jgi:hypothetical protein